MTQSEAWTRICRYCAYQERCHLEVRRKLGTFALEQSIVEELVTRLVLENFLNEERFARLYAGGKFRLKKWGRARIRRELAKKGLTEKCIDLGLSEIDPDDYRTTLVELLQARNKESGEENIYVRRNVIAKYAIGKGYEPALVWDEVRNAFPG